MDIEPMATLPPDPIALATQQLYRELNALKELTFTRFDAQTALMEQKFTSLQRAVDKAETSQDQRNQLNNEFRGQLKDQAATFITREYLEVALKSLNERIVALQNYRANMEGRIWAVGAGFAVLNLVIAGYAAWHSGGGLKF